MGISSQCPFPHLGKQIRDTEIIIAGDAQRQRVNEEPDYPFQLRVRAVSHRGADNNILLPAEPIQYQTPGTEHRHKQGGVMALPQLFQGIQ
ncbi:hypothetical protein Xkoz_03651 [Xenorhabdus kozodoii]|uniref:Uncharacterized protein n=1 Tax=Xenorhabdus kozodoii TaxID=351676 RepID=A0A2D0KZ17_9GAMM|nr:hypothetical protein Xkoz_03651 [Xenorhabdus kozodoii]